MTAEGGRERALKAMEHSEAAPLVALDAVCENCCGFYVARADPNGTASPL